MYLFTCQTTPSPHPHMRTRLSAFCELGPRELLSGTKSKRHRPRLLKAQHVAPSSCRTLDKTSMLVFKSLVLLLNRCVRWLNDAVLCHSKAHNLRELCVKAFACELMSTGSHSLLRRCTGSARLTHTEREREIHSMCSCLQGYKQNRMTPMHVPTRGGRPSGPASNLLMLMSKLFFSAIFAAAAGTSIFCTSFP